jgi:hypothetical protein
MSDRAPILFASGNRTAIRTCRQLAGLGRLSRDGMNNIGREQGGVLVISRGLAGTDDRRDDWLFTYASC